MRGCKKDIKIDYYCKITRRKSTGNVNTEYMMNSHILFANAEAAIPALFFRPV